MALFLSTYVNRIDKKGRVSVPAQFRAVLAGQNFNGIVAYPSFVNPAVEAAGMDRIEKLSASIDELDPFSEERDAFATSILAECVQIAFDSEGRIVIPERLMDVAGLGDRAAFVGKGQTFEIWEPERYSEHQKAARERAFEQRAKLRLRKAAPAGEEGA